MRFVVGITSPVASAEYLRSVFESRGVKFVGLVNAAKEADFMSGHLGVFARNNADVVQYFHIDEGVARYESLEQPDVIVYGYEYDIKSADLLAAAIAPAFANDSSTADRREDKAVMNDALEAAGMLTLAHTVLEPRRQKTGPLDLSGLSSSATHVVIKSTRYKEALYVTPKKAAQRLIDNLQADGRLGVELLIQDAYFDFDSDGLQQTYNIEGFVLSGAFHFVALHRWHKIIDPAGIRYCWTEQLDVHDHRYAPVLEFTERVLQVVGLENGFFHPEVSKVDGGFVILDLNPRVAGGDGIVDRLIKSTQGAGVIDRFLEEFYDLPAIAPSSVVPRVCLLVIYGLDVDDVTAIRRLASVAEVVFDGYVSAHVVRFEHADSLIFEQDIVRCMRSYVSLPGCADVRLVTSAGFSSDE